MSAARAAAMPSARTPLAASAFFPSAISDS